MSGRKVVHDGSDHDYRQTVDNRYVKMAAAKEQLKNLYYVHMVFSMAVMGLCLAEMSKKVTVVRALDLTPASLIVATGICQSFWYLVFAGATGQAGASISRMISLFSFGAGLETLASCLFASYLLLVSGKLATNSFEVLVLVGLCLFSAIVSVVGLVSARTYVNSANTANKRR